MKRALVGYTGFVGSNLVNQAEFTHLYNSGNADEIRGQKFDELAFSAASAVKWKANKDPDKDQAHIKELLSLLNSVDANLGILISTVDIYPSPRLVDENSTIDSTQQHAYGKHRYQLEQDFCKRFNRHLVVRLPGLFGPGLKKNAIFDLLNDHETHKIPPNGVFQFYDIGWLWNDIQRALKEGISLLNLATEPTSMKEIAEKVFGARLDSPPSNPAPKYDFRSIFAEEWGGADGYLYSKQCVLAAMKHFVDNYEQRIAS